ncbi:MAG: HD domain-containing protein [Candidatus Spyradocola sp.]
MDYRAIGDMIAYYDNQNYIAHTLKVFGYAQGIAAGEGVTGQEREIIEYAALFHDVGIPAGMAECGSGAGPVQERLGAPIAMEMTRRYVSDPEIIERVGYLVGHHHSFGIKGQRDLQILFEADWLVNLIESAEKYDRRIVYEKHFETATGREYFHHVIEGKK